MDLLPFEIKESVLSEIDLRKDLLALSLTSSHWHSLVVPKHLHYRLIRCTLQEGTPIWSLLSNDKGLARNIRAIELIFSEKRTHMPNSPAFSPPLRLFPSMSKSPSTTVNEAPSVLAERLLSTALRNMSRLRCFQWWSPQLTIPTGPWRKDIWSTVAGIEELDLWFHDERASEVLFRSNVSSTILIPKCTNFERELTVDRLTAVAYVRSEESYSPTGHHY